MSAAAKKAISKSVKETDSRSGTVTHYPSEVTVTTSGKLIVNVTGLLGTSRSWFCCPWSGATYSQVIGITHATTLRVKRVIASIFAPPSGEWPFARCC
jgi:hypothetical protein